MGNIESISLSQSTYFSFSVYFWFYGRGACVQLEAWLGGVPQ
jgi:hypothetical protein